MAVRVRDIMNDDNCGQTVTLLRDVVDKASRDRLMSIVVDHQQPDVPTGVLARAFRYWLNLHQTIGQRMAEGVCNGVSD